MKKLFLSLTLVASSFSASAEFVDGHKLQGWLISDEALGAGYVAGVFDAAIGSSHCAPSKTTVKQVMDLTLATMHAAPSKLSQSADRFVLTALNNRFPCPKKNGV
jgi:hypothetical protein